MPAGARCHVSIDIDQLDLPLVRDTLAAIAARTQVIGFDFMEMNPRLDVGTASSPVPAPTP